MIRSIKNEIDILTNNSQTSSILTILVTNKPADQTQSTKRKVYFAGNSS